MKLCAMSTFCAGDRQLERLGRAAHREQKSAALDELPDLLGDVLLERRNVGEAEPLRRRRVLLQQVDEPGCVAIGQVELVQLPGEVLVVQMQPVVLRQIAVLDLVVVDRRVLDAGVLERERDGVVPRQRVGRRVDGDLRRLLERDRLHVARGDLGANLAELRVVDRLEGDAREARLAPQLGRVGEQERAAAIVQQPLGRRAGLDRVVREAVRLEVVLLGVVHRHEQALRARDCAERDDSNNAATTRARESRNRHRHHGVGGMALFARSSSRRACGTSALCGYVRIMCSRCVAAPGRVALAAQAGAPTRARPAAPRAYPCPGRECASRARSPASSFFSAASNLRRGQRAATSGRPASASAACDELRRGAGAVAVARARGTRGRSPARCRP